MHIGLYQAVARLARHFGVTWLVAISDYAVYRLIRLQLRRIFVAYGDERSYLGSARSVPAYCPIRDAELEAAAADSSLHELIYVGSAIKDALRQIELAPAIEALQGLFDRSGSLDELTLHASNGQRARIIVRGWGRIVAVIDARGSMPRVRTLSRISLQGSQPIAGREQVEHVLELVDSGRPGVHVALGDFTADLLQAAGLLHGLDTLGDRADAERVRHRHDRGDEGLRSGVDLVQRLDKAAVDLQHVEGETLQVGQRRVFGAEVVDGER